MLHVSADADVGNSAQLVLTSLERCCKGDPLELTLMPPVSQGAAAALLMSRTTEALKSL